MTLSEPHVLRAAFPSFQRSPGTPGQPPDRPLGVCPQTLRPTLLRRQGRQPSRHVRRNQPGLLKNTMKCYLIFEFDFADMGFNQLWSCYFSYE